MENSGLKLSILMPVFNEEKTVAEMLERVLSSTANAHEIIVVDDGSTDGTEEIVASQCEKHPAIRLFRLEKNQGKTAAVRRAIQEAVGDILIVQDADLEYDPNEIAEIIRPIQTGQADVVYGSRFMVRRAARVLYFYHYLANKFLTLLSNVLTNRNMSDIETCYKAFRAGVIKPLKITSRRFGMEVEITAMVCQTKARTYEVPISYYGRTYDEGKKIGLRDGFAAIYYILFYNLIKPWTRKGRLYVREVNQFLDQLREKDDLRGRNDE